MIRVNELVPCDVCRLLDGDLTPKNCFYCAFCDSNICQEDGLRWDRRARAFLKRKFEATFKGDPNYQTNTEFDGQVNP